MSAFVTTSWDDGGTLDLKLANKLAEHGVAGTLYWSVDAQQFPMASPSEIAEILTLDVEIGSHTVTHPDLTDIDATSLAWELTESKRRLEDITGRSITSFCYPFGRFNGAAAEAVEAAGYDLARTTVGFRSDVGSDPYRVPVTIQMYPHGHRVHVTHALKELNLTGLARWVSRYGRKTDLLALVETAMIDLDANGGVLHIWGHSWELEQFELWDTLDQVLAIVASDPAVSHVPNHDLLSLPTA